MLLLKIYPKIIAMHLYKNFLTLRKLALISSTISVSLPEIREFCAISFPDIAPGFCSNHFSSLEDTFPSASTSRPFHFPHLPHLDHRIFLASHVPSSWSFYYLILFNIVIVIFITIAAIFRFFKLPQYLTGYLL